MSNYLTHHTSDGNVITRVLLLIIGTHLDADAAMYVRKKTDVKEIWNTSISSIRKHASNLLNVFDDILEEL